MSTLDLTSSRTRSTPRPWFAGSIGILAAVGGLALVWSRSDGFDVPQTFALIQSISILQWCLAGLATLGSFLALGSYDALWHRILQTKISPARARRAGMAAVAIGQTLGLASVTSTLVRWRCLPDLKFIDVAKITGAVCLSFMIGWALFAGWAAWFVMAPVIGFEVTPLIWLVSFAGLIGALTWLHRKGSLKIADAFALFFWTGIDLACAATVLWVLLPAGTEISWLALVAAYVLALGAGLIGNSPGGVGPFELVILTVLPDLSAEAAVAGIVAYRLVYYLPPFMIAVFYAICSKRAARPVNVSGPADWRLAAQSGQIRRLGDQWAHVLSPCWGLAMAHGDPEPTAPGLALLAGPPKRIRAVYKSSARLASVARKAGWDASLIALEAVLDPQEWSLEGRRKRRLRQALRRAQAAGVTIQYAGADLPMTRITQIAKIWARQHGGELGLTMGRYEPSYILGQHVFLIYHDGLLRGFITCNADRDWSLDLMRQDGLLPDGAMQTAIVAALEKAKQGGAKRFSLGAVPAQDGVLSKWSGSKEGLILFKRNFDPVWQKRYFITQTRLEMLLFGLATLIAVHRPVNRSCTKIMRRLHVSVASFGIAKRFHKRDTREMFEDKDTACAPLTTL